MKIKKSIYLKPFAIIALVFFLTSLLSFTSPDFEIKDDVDLNSFLIGTLLGNDIVFYEQPLIEKFRKSFLKKSNLEYLERVMKRSAPYRDYIIKKLVENDMPLELLFLPVIESGFKETAVSKSGAVGIWQFMLNSVGGYNINISEWVDERRDPWKSTDAAIKKLKYNYAVLQDWPLALAAYNCGLGAVKRAIRKSGRADYWYLCERGFFKKETVYYVPKFLAVCEILMRSHEYGISWGDKTDYCETETVKLKRAVDIVMVAEELNIDISLMKSLNPSLKYNITPPDFEYLLRIPSDSKEQVVALLSEKNKVLVRYYIYSIKSGDTLYALSRHYGVSVKTILNYNRSVNPNALQLGQKLIIPALKSVSAYTRPKKKLPKVNFTGKYKVQKGDTLWSIAGKYGVDIETLASENNINLNSVLSVGATLSVPNN